MPHYDNEERLAGGNVSDVYRVGATVRRELKPESRKVHKLLKHLEYKGFTYAPRYIGIDEKGREILTFIEGKAGNDPNKEYMWSEGNLIEIARMLRRYHDSVSDFHIEEDWAPIDHTPQPFEVLCHNDFAIYNIIFKDEKPVGIIDFDVAGPGPRLWDIAYTLYTCVPLSRVFYSESGEAYPYKPSLHARHIKHRVQLFFKSYGVAMKKDYIDMVLLRLEGLTQTIQRKAEEGDRAFQEMVDEGHVEHYRKDIEFIRTHGNEWI
ncbi:phosphotransferase [Halobacillus yeomjeoni]|uniref:phosphotransferase n=1 Tax=Halobacillus yeomjeoni TaxID=311194 RepID=UPI001CD43B93|nr:phosphotransferase [Halobacillus yeomjeoni]MCA0983240.1 phosphotransferase [Halobacillus yeomjeoni]